MLRPVLVGAATVEQHAEPGEGRNAGELLGDVATLALADTQSRLDGSMVDLVIATQGLSMLEDGASRVAQAIGAADARCVTYQVGIPQQALINRAIDAVRSGDAAAVLVVGAEAKRRDDLARRAGIELAPIEPMHTADEVVAREGEIVARPEIDIGAVAPVQQYAMIDSARRAANGWSLDEHRDDIASLWARFNTVAQGNPKAAFAAPMTAADIRDPSPTNRLLAFPYNKWHNSQWGVDQAAAFVITSETLMVQTDTPPDRRVYLHVGLESSQSLSLSRRADLYRWPAMGVLGETAASALGRPLRTLDFTELYSCFPAAVRVQQAELGLAPEAPASITGGMAFAGGPFNNFVFQATVAMAEQLRAEPGTFGLVTSVSGLLTKPGLAVWSTEPCADPMVGDLVARATEATGVAELDEDPDGPGVVATYTTSGPRVSAIIDLERGARAVAACDDEALSDKVTRDDLIGTRVQVTGRTFEL